MNLELLYPDWPVPTNVRACSTTRIGGYSEAPFAGLNLGIRAGDAPDRVRANRQLLGDTLQLPAEPTWLWQVHGNRVVNAATAAADEQADAAWCDVAGSVCTVMTADCLPVLFCDRDGTCVAVAHAGWRGLLGGVLEATIAAMPVPANALLAWLGPCIGPTAFEVGADVFDAYCEVNQDYCRHFVGGDQSNKWWADLHGLAASLLHAAGVSDIYREPRCTVTEPDVFYSYRREGASSGRMATLIWLLG